MKILVTGGAGFIGSHIVDRYITDGHQVLVIDDLSTGSEANLNRKVKFLKLDIRSKDAFNLVVAEKPEIINHHAAQIDLRRSVEEPLWDAEINILGLLNLMEGARQVKSVKKVIFASTGGAIYGDASIIPTPENYPAWPISPYGVAKLTCEHYLHYYQEVHGIPFVSLRYGNVYGPRQNPKGEAGVIAIFSGRLLSGEQPVISGDGKQTRDFVFVEDVVEANAKALSQKAKGINNIGTGKETDVTTIFDELRKQLAPTVKPLYGPVKKGEQRRSSLDSKKALKEFGWQPRTELRNGLEKTAEFFKRGR
ncbi:MAG: UDP-glucose 4-epimerase [Candidatus Chisholmbacteria bacterium RIFCSPHIGHO2_12_FULL_49_9]|uniref:UDP-glucose 4-epimerase n=1 Tax=Candidatus Chisholmbacteria bacterium RIFCSPHIGHO2_01_FULL_52_32 TaxID=1797591 RepID=A0A1G1VSZ6_9BACT|nr:MAG: UDP-glucose 4-epimerase [Candidatus Chisholmbacteria bacterium RIFCSPHIGHO2_12_FULL_49_9]OGY18531.1 MAG: UDP-glucose 4-epimerase [Candidatus Chisholmbacteria bacterium RIFCSPHIGHO2_01_FULL_52_32]OGY20098.1 MAG: UDP-glucose 4-epimerase [Candidatus Chisholmbacteria bacterium RIFCSPLOWO2_01_FULL_50_28]